MSLYRRLLADQWNALAAPIRRVHADTAPVNASGRFRICHGMSRVARALVRLAGLPPAGDDVPTQLTITSMTGGERWLRSFDGTPMLTFQRQSSPGVLAERFGRLELRFRLDVTGGGIRYHQVGAAFCLGWLRLPLPRWLVPQVSAWERPGEDSVAACVRVSVSVPLVGFLISYEGEIQPEERAGVEDQTL